VVAIFSLASILPTTFLLPESLPQAERAPFGRSRAAKPGQKGLLDVIRVPNVQIILLFTTLTFLAFSLLQSSFAFLSRRNLFADISLEEAQRNIGLLLTWIGVISVTTQFVFVGPLVVRFGKRRLVNVGAVARVVAYLGIASARDWVTMALVFIPFAAASAACQPSLQSILSRFSPPKTRGFQSSNSLTLVIGPILAGILLQLNLPSLSPQIAVTTPMFVGAFIMVIAFLMSFRVLRMMLLSQDSWKLQPDAASADWPAPGKAHLTGKKPPQSGGFWLSACSIRQS